MSPAPRVAILEKQGGVLSWHEDLAAGFRELGAEVVTIQMRPRTLAEYAAKWRTGCSTLENPVTLARVSQELKTIKPNLVIVLKHAGLPPKSLEQWRAALPSRVPLVGWVCDHLPAWNNAHTPGFDGVYYFDSATRPTLEEAYAGDNARLRHLPLAVNPLRYPTTHRPFSRRLPRLVFAGTNSPSRNQQIEAYRKVGGLIDAYGPKARSGWRLWRRCHLHARNLARLYERYFAVFNLVQSPNTVNGLNLRAFEVPAAGGLSTYPVVPDLPGIFEPGREVVAYKDIADLKQQMEPLLARPELAEKIAASGRARVLQEHTFAHRARVMLNDWT